jgi:hypothetical protein
MKRTSKRTLKLDIIIAVDVTAQVYFVSAVWTMQEVQIYEEEVQKNTEGGCDYCFILGECILLRM